MGRDFARFKPVSDDVFNAYKLLYAYPQTPLNAQVDGVVKETVDWREEKVTFDTAYGGERMSAYLFLPKNVRPPYQTVLFFPSARVEFIRDSRKLGDLKFFDYVVQSGRAVMYPVYLDTYERQVNFYLPEGLVDNELKSPTTKTLLARSIILPHVPISTAANWPTWGSAWARQRESSFRLCCRIVSRLLFFLMADTSFFRLRPAMTRPTLRPG